MRPRSCMVCLLFAALAGRAGAQAPDAHADALAGLLLLPCAVRAQNYITPEQAVQAVRDFWGDQAITATATGPYDGGQTSGLGVSYHVQVTASPKAGSYRVLATTGTVLYFDLDHSEGTARVVSEADAQAAAEAFVTQHGPRSRRASGTELPTARLGAGLISTSNGVQCSTSTACWGPTGFAFG